MKLKGYAPYYIFGLITLALVGVAVGRFLTHKNLPPQHAMLYDQSISKIDGCSCIKNYGRRLVESAVSPGEVATLYSLGTAANGFQPQLVDTFPIPKDISVLGDKQKAKAEVESFLNALETKCKSIPRSDRTPLVLGVRTILEQLRPKCSPESRCSLYVQSDLVEDVSPEFLKAFDAEKAGRASADFERFDNTNIPVTFAGTVEVVVARGKKKSSKDKSLQVIGDGRIWKNLWSHSFTHSQSLTFQPICDRDSENAAPVRTAAKR